ncbi:MAG: putative transposase [Mycobacterium sp.]|jgi:putative transposase|nr:putative transposase [Mycobacterium sp.]MDT7721312.1 putative transposase [Mycobacterium sp.]
MKTVPTVRLADTTDAAVLPDLPEEIGLAMTDIAGAAREGLLALSVAAAMATYAYDQIDQVRGELNAVSK